MVIGPTNAMSVIAWRETRLYIGDVAATSAASTPARRLTKRETHQVDARRCPSTPIRQNGTRTAHSARVEPSAIVAAASARARRCPTRCIARLMIQNDSTGFDQKCVGVDAASPATTG